MDEPPDLGLLFHRLNNQLGIILANAELLEAKAADEMTRARASQVVASVLDAMATAREIRLRSKQLTVSQILAPYAYVGVNNTDESIGRFGPRISRLFTPIHSR